MKKEDWSKSLPILNWSTIRPKRQLGDVDAETEWNDDAKQSSTIFFHIESYGEFKEQDCLFLFGRRGTGKTAIIRMLDYEIKRGDAGPYIFSNLIDQEKTFINLIRQIRQSQFAEMIESELIFYLTKSWEWIIITSAMLSVYANIGIDSRNDNLKIIHDFLKRNNLLDEPTPINRIIDIISKTRRNIKRSTNILKLIEEFLKDLISSPDFREAKRALSNILTKEKGYCLVMIDSLERINISDKIAISVISSLVQAVRNIYQNRQNRILAKAAFPSEIYTHIDIFNPGKIEVKNLFINWSYNDLFCLISMRFYKYLIKEGEKLRYIDTCIAKEAKCFLYEYLPETIETRHGINIDTFAYILRHTHKTPRHIIILFNVIMTIAEKMDIPLRNMEQKFIREAVHARLDIITKEAIEVYNMIYDGADKIITTILSNEKNIFSGKLLDKFIKKASSLIHRKNINAEEIKRLLFESGSVGIVIKKQKGIQSTDKLLIEAYYQYQKKSYHKSPEKVICVIHPMMYRYFYNEVDLNKFVYPQPFENEEINVLRESGILLE